MWKELMFEIKNDTLILGLDYRVGLLEELKQASVALDRIQKCLNDYLESKRKFFPRFYFLSNEDLLEILGDSKKPLKVQAHLKKIFEGVNKLTFKHGETEIIGAESKEGETIEYIESIFPLSFGSNVEQWLVAVERVQF
jgi:dynein heavy chain, axonemal